MQRTRSSPNPENDWECFFPSSRANLHSLSSARAAATAIYHPASAPLKLFSLHSLLRPSLAHRFLSSFAAAPAAAAALLPNRKKRKKKKIHRGKRTFLSLSLSRNPLDGTENRRVCGFDARSCPLSLYLYTRQRNPCFFFIPCS
jgi:hypothetical protein